MDTPPFASLGLPQPLLDAIVALGYERPSPIQAMAIPPALAGEDVVGLSATGSGKTAAFALPALAKINLAMRRPQVLILTPTRELAVQVCEEVHRLAARLEGFQATPLYGGAPMDRQLRALRSGPHLVVGTPGRLLDHMRRGSFDPSTIALTVLDEADRMLDMGFREEMEELLKAMPEARQTLFFSATMSPGVARLIQRFGKQPRTIEMKQRALTVATIEQSYYEVRQRSKVEVISRILDMAPPRLAIIFCNTKRAVDECTEDLIARGYSADRLHGDMTQQMRERVLKRFREGLVEILVATDVAARGLDIDEIDLVLNYDLPADPEDYVHRIGRTGRAGRSGRAASFIFGKEIYRLQAVERYTRQRITRATIPSVEEVEGRRADLLFEALKARLEAGNFLSFQNQIDRLLDQGHTATDIACALATMLRDETGREGTAIQEDAEKGRLRGLAERSEGNAAKKMRAGHVKRRGERDRGRAEEGMARLFLSVGKLAGVQAKDIVGMFYREAGLPDGSLGHISLFAKHTLVELPEELADEAIARLRSAKLRGKAFRIDRDRIE